MSKAYKTMDDLYHKAASSDNDDEFIKDYRSKNVIREIGGFMNKNEESFDDFMKRIKKN